MLSKRILALSSSRVGNSSYLESSTPIINDFLGSKATNIAFIPFASVDNNYEEYTSKVRKALKNLPHNIETVFSENAKSIIDKNDVIMVGGGNTFKLLHDIYQLNLLDTIRDKINAGTPYIGWSAGANIIGATLCTTNDMPIIEPKSFNALGLFPFQINPHYVNQKQEGFNGETRDERLEEFIKINPGVPIICLPEGTALQMKNNTLKYSGKESATLFYLKKGKKHFSREMVRHNSDLSFLL
jgi:dipeptidase E